MSAPIVPDWLEPAAAATLILSSLEPLGSERLALRDALGRILDHDLVSPIDLPRWANSGMDGFAVHADDVVGAGPEAPITLPVLDDIAAGSFPRGPLARGSAARVMTGAPVPTGADSVIRIEHTGGLELEGGRASVRILDSQDAGRNIRPAGGDVRAGKITLRRGTLLTPAALGVAASIGCSELTAIRRPRVALLTSGDELVEVEEFDQVREGRKIVSSNSITLAAELTRMGCEVRYLGIARDTPEDLEQAIRRAEGCDALITSGGISVGEHDYVKAVLLGLGTQLSFWRVRMRPGSPLAFGMIDAFGGIPWFGLPGNPVSSLVTFELFVRPALLRISGYDEVFRVPVEAELLDSFQIPPGLTHFGRVKLESRERGGWAARLTGNQGSGVLSAMVDADGLVRVPPGLGRVEAGMVLEVVPLGPEAKLLRATPPY